MKATPYICALKTIIFQQKKYFYRFKMAAKTLLKCIHFRMQAPKTKERKKDTLK
jgi:hypothetical protein